MAGSFGSVGVIVSDRFIDCLRLLEYFTIRIYIDTKAIKRQNKCFNL